MQPLWLSRVILILAACLAGGMPWSLAQSASNSVSEQATADVNPSDPDRQRGIQLCREYKMPEAAALLEKVVARYPKDSAAHEYLGVAFLGRRYSDGAGKEKS